MIWRETRQYSNGGVLDKGGRGLEDTVLYIFEHDNYHLILVLYIFITDKAKLKNEVYKNSVKMSINFLVKHIFIFRIDEKTPY